jgi:preprotein translocase subunit SecY
VFQRLANIFRVPDLRNKVLFTLAMIMLYQLGANIPTPGVSWAKVQLLQTSAGTKAGALGFLNLFSGGALTRIAVFGLGIMPYITSTIVMQLLQTVVPKFAQWRDQGAVGQRKITQATRYLTIALAVLQSSGLVYAFHNHDSAFLGSNVDLMVKGFNIWMGMLMVVILTAGTVLVMWLAELVTQRGIGQGMSLLIFSSVVSGLPTGGRAVWDQAGPGKFFFLLFISLALLVFIVFVDQGQRRIPVTFARRIVGRKMTGGTSTYIPFKVNHSGVIPIIFATSLLYIPILLSNIVPWTGFQNFVNTSLHPTNGLYILADFVLIFAFCFFWVQVAFDPFQQADQLRKQGGFIPGIRPGQPTERYFSRVTNRITLVGATFLASVAIVPSIFMALWGIQKFPYYGTTLLIAVGVALQTMQQIDSQLMMRNYEGFLK